MRRSRAPSAGLDARLPCRPSRRRMSASRDHRRELSWAVGPLQGALNRDQRVVVALRIEEDLRAVARGIVVVGEVDLALLEHGQGSRRVSDRLVRQDPVRVEDGACGGRRRASGLLFEERDPRARQAPGLVVPPEAVKSVDHVVVEVGAIVGQQRAGSRPRRRARPPRRARGAARARALLRGGRPRSPSPRAERRPGASRGASAALRPHRRSRTPRGASRRSAV